MRCLLDTKSSFKTRGRRLSLLSLQHGKHPRSAFQSVFLSRRACRVQNKHEARKQTPRLLVTGAI